MHTSAKIATAAVSLATSLVAPAQAALADSASPARPANACSGSNVYKQILKVYSVSYRTDGLLYTDYNGTGNAATVKLTNEVTKTFTWGMSGGVSAGFKLWVFTEVKAHFDGNVSWSRAVKRGHEIDFTVPAHLYGHGYYGAYYRSVRVKTYQITGAHCNILFNVHYGTFTFPRGEGWKVWTSKSA
ncbi:MAG TPA: hypothetical protein VNW94_11010 [Streptosporangiaceae bacterium]|nr:hypothetical protein [Streptosporangiaceae bacterium]